MNPKDIRTSSDPDLAGSRIDLIGSGSGSDPTDMLVPLPAAKSLLMKVISGGQVWRTARLAPSTLLW